MQKHIRYEVEIIADPEVSPSMAQLNEFFISALRSVDRRSFEAATTGTFPEKSTSDSGQPRRGRPKKSPPAAANVSPSPSKRPEEQLFTIRRTDTPVDVYFGELDEVVEKLKAREKPKPSDNPKWFEPYQATPWHPTPTCCSKEPKFTISGVSYVPELPDTVDDPQTIEKLKNVKSVSISASCEESHIDGEGVLHVPASTQPLYEIDETA